MVAAAAPAAVADEIPEKRWCFGAHPGVEATYPPRRQVGGAYRRRLASSAAAAWQHLADQAGGGQVTARPEHARAS